MVWRTYRVALTEYGARSVESSTDWRVSPIASLKCAGLGISVPKPGGLYWAQLAGCSRSQRRVKSVVLR